MNILDNFDFKELEAINLIKETCAKFNANAYIVGGAIRDSILNVKPKDIDICIESNPINIISKLNFVKEYKYYEKFQTSTIVFENEVEIDLIRCRKEKYEFNGALPKVIPSNIMDDLFRRDFTCNAIAYNLVNDTIIDPFNGRDDINKGILRKIHENSYMEDPTRIFRAIKYANRYDFKIHDKDEIKESLLKKSMNNISNDRIIREIVSLCKEEKWIHNIFSCNELNILNIEKSMFLEDKFLFNYKDYNDRILNVFLSSKGNRGIFIKNSVLCKDIKKAFENYNNGITNKNYLLNEKDNFSIYNKLKNFSTYDIKILAHFKENKYKLLNYIHNLKNMKLDVNGKYLSQLSLNNKTKYKDILNYLYMIKLNTGIRDDVKYLFGNLGEILNVVKYKN
ncbi:CCA tRNA nucleotidyltransferase [Clostridium novyi]|uniref:CCA tRNA nucleotidyltransferase n=1 Tax=Clostridium novyi TaxID=1542 RepID=UPI0004D98A11|nr:CCA tRNA nucleotidyltransferase [Clostridium novyi]KEH92415.1 poly(A) polymerase [Clostridium novyi A str. GD211209]